MTIREDGLAIEPGGGSQASWAWTCDPAQNHPHELENREGAEALIKEFATALVSWDRE